MIAHSLNDASAAPIETTRPWPMAVLLGAAFLTLLMLSALAAAFFVSHWSAQADAANAEALVEHADRDMYRRC